ncbi:glutamine amidotransferase [Shimia biformata]|uniref:glutamine amidotransferase n=1 Tax=Shimia biformata TaxID=1294299 RepID=UPI0019520D18|nr:glutamine amidotransferase [Shimia biformata]
MTGTVMFDPILPLWTIAVLAAMSALGVGIALWRGLPGWWLRGLAAAAVIAALCGPVLQRENRAPLSDIVLMLVDQSASQQLASRATDTEAAATELAARISVRPNTELRRIDIGDGEGDTGTLAMAALAEAMAQEPRGRIAGVFLISDGRVHDIDRAPDLPAPLHLLHTGRERDWDRRLLVKNAPAFAILGEPVTLTLSIEDSGAVPAGADRATLLVSVDGDEPVRFEVPTGEEIDVPLSLNHGGRNVIEFSTPEAEGELTDRNNSALIQINGVRDRLRVLLVSGEPHPGGRTWRNLLKSDASVDLVHFTILRPPEKQDGVPVTELSLIAFPTRELFMDKITDFDLIIFDRYKRRGILPSLYLDNVVNYVREGGALLVAAGPDFATAASIYRTPLADILPARPTARIVAEGFTPKVSELGERHPVTSGLPDAGSWGRWLRQIEVEPQSGHVVMTGAEDRPLLILDRVDEGRVALLASDHAWLWARGFEGGGPQLEILRRLAHWMMAEPELEEDMLWAEPTGQTMRIIRRTLDDTVGDVTVTSPSGAVVNLPMNEVSPGHYETVFEGAEIGLYRLENGGKTAVIGLGPAAPREFEQTIATDEIVKPVLASMRGGAVALEDGLPRLRDVREGRPAAGRGWLGLTPRGAYETLDVVRTPLLPAWVVLLIVAGLITAGWMREGRR